MGKTVKAADEIKQLRDEKLKVEQWLERLAAPDNKTPEQVRDRVRDDYKGRLDQVVAELQGHSAAISDALGQQRELRGGLAKQEGDAMEKLAEAELRHSVGEYGEDEWTKLESEIGATLDKVRGDLAGIDAEIADLEGVMAIVSAPARSKAATEKAAPVPSIEPAAVQTPVVAEATVSGGKTESAPEPQQDAFDGLGFTKSVTEDETHGLSAARASGQMLQPAEAIEDVPAGGEVEPVPEPPRASKSVGAEGVTSFAETTGQPTKAQAKTLKCSECGALNLATEWYCERCGAELSVL